MSSLSSESQSYLTTQGRSTISMFNSFVLAMENCKLPHPACLDFRAFHMRIAATHHMRFTSHLTGRTSSTSSLIYFLPKIAFSTRFDRLPSSYSPGLLLSDRHHRFNFVLSIFRVHQRRRLPAIHHVVSHPRIVVSHTGSSEGGASSSSSGSSSTPSNRGP